MDFERRVSGNDLEIGEPSSLKESMIVLLDESIFE